MHVDNAVLPTSEQIQGLLSREADGPVVMVNLLKFREKALYKDGRADDISGADAYARYAERMVPLVEAGGGRFVFGGDVTGLVVGAVDELWDVVALVEYPSRAEFVTLTSTPEVREIGVHRAAGLEGQLLIETTARPF